MSKTPAQTVKSWVYFVVVFAILVGAYALGLEFEYVVIVALAHISSEVVIDE